VLSIHDYYSSIQSMEIRKMFKLGVAIAVASICLIDSTLANDVFVRQLSPDRAPVSMRQVGGSGTVFVEQIPEHARPLPRRPAGATTASTRAFVPQVFIAERRNTPEQAIDSTALVIDTEASFQPYGEKAVPSLPNVGAGSTVVASASDVAPNIPTVGSGVVILQ
jgi:hypothetical protein